MHLQKIRGKQNKKTRNKQQLTQLLQRRSNALSYDNTSRNENFSVTGSFWTKQVNSPVEQGFRYSQVLSPRGGLISGSIQTPLIKNKIKIETDEPYRKLNLATTLGENEFSRINNSNLTIFNEEDIEKRDNLQTARLVRKLESKMDLGEKLAKMAAKDFDDSVVEHTDRTIRRTPITLQNSVQIDPIQDSVYNLRSSKENIIKASIKYNKRKHNLIYVQNSQPKTTTFSSLVEFQQQASLYKTLKSSTRQTTEKTKRALPYISLFQAQDVHEKHFINKQPQELISYLDEKIQGRKKTLYVESICDAVINDLEIDQYIEDVNNFINKRLDYSYRGKTSNICQPLKVTHENCGMLRIPALQKYDYDKLGRLRVHDFRIEEKWNHKILPLPKIHKVGTFNPVIDKINCKHNESDTDLKYTIRKVFAQIHNFKKKLKEIFNNYQKKPEVFQKLAENFFNLQNLTEEEKILFSDEKTGIALLMSPLLRLVKADLRKLEEESKRSQQRKKIRVQTISVDNSSANKYKYEDGLALQDLTESQKRSYRIKVDPFGEGLPINMNLDRYKYNLSHEAQEYAEKLQKLVEIDFKDKNYEELNDIIEPCPKQAILRELNSKSYIIDPTFDELEQRSNDLIKKIPRGSCKLEIKKSWFLAQVRELLILFHKYWLHEKMSMLKTRIFISDEIEFEQLTKAKVPNNITTLVKGADAFQSWKSMKLLKGQSSGNINHKKLKLTQAQQDILLQQETPINLFEDQVLKKRFFDFIKTCENQVFENEEEQQIFKMYQEFQKNKIVPIPLHALIKNETLILENMPMTQAYTNVLCKFIVWRPGQESVDSFDKISLISESLESNSEDSFLNQKLDDSIQFNEVRIKNCKMKDNQIGDILNAISRRCKVAKIHIENESINNASIRPIKTILCRIRPHSLLELSLIRCQSLSQSALRNLLNALLDQSNLSKLVLSNFCFQPSTTANYYDDLDQGPVSLLCQYLIEKSSLSEYQSLNQVLTHLELSYLSLQPLQLSMILQSLSSYRTLEFLSLKGNKLVQEINGVDQSIYINNFNHNLEAFINADYKSLTHLDLAEMGQGVDVRRLIEVVATKAEVMQVINVDIQSRQEQLLIGQMLGVSWIRPEQQIQVSSDSGSSNQLRLIIEKNCVDHLIGERFDQSIQTLKIAQTVKKITQSYRCSFSRNLIKDYYDISYQFKNGLYRPYIDDGETNWRWKLNKNCHICENKQFIQIYSDRNTFKQIKNPKVIKAIKALYLGFCDLRQPVIFGSFSNWKVYEMIPAELHTLNLLRKNLLKVQNQEIDLNLEQYQLLLKKLFQDYDKKDFDGVFQINHTEYRDFMYREYLYEKMINAQVFGDKNENYLFEKEVHVGKHSVIMYDPETDQMFARNIIVTEKRKKENYGKIQAQSSYGFDILRQDQWKLIEVESQIGLDCQFVKDMEQFGTNLDFQKIKSFYVYYKQINDKFIELSANQDYNLFDLQSNLVYPHLFIKDAANYLGDQRTIDPQKLSSFFISRQEFIAQAFENFETMPKSVQSRDKIKISKLDKEWIEKSQLDIPERISLEQIKGLLNIDINSLIKLRSKLGINFRKDCELPISMYRSKIRNIDQVQLNNEFDQIQKQYYYTQSHFFYLNQQEFLDLVQAYCNQNNFDFKSIILSLKIIQKEPAAFKQDEIEKVKAFIERQSKPQDIYGELNTQPAVYEDPQSKIIKTAKQLDLPENYASPGGFWTNMIKWE